MRFELFSVVPLCLPLLLWAGMNNTVQASSCHISTTDAAKELVERGYVHMRSCSIAKEPLTSPAFANISMSVWRTAGFDYGLGDYEGGSVEREKIPGGAKQVLDVAAGSPRAHPVQPHSENAYLHRLPHLAAFGQFHLFQTWPSPPLFPLICVSITTTAQQKPTSCIIVIP